MLRSSMIAIAVAVSAPMGIVASPATATDAAASLTAGRVSDGLAPLLKMAQLVSGDTWTSKVRVKGFKEVKLQIKAAKGPFRTVKTYRVPKSGVVKIVRAFPKPGLYQARTIAVRGRGSGREVEGGSDHCGGEALPGDLRW